MDKDARWLDELRELQAETSRPQWRLVSDAAQVAAYYLRCHPCVEAVRYPGVRGDALFEKAARTLVGGFGPEVRYRVAGEWHTLVCGPGDPRAQVMALERELAKGDSPQLARCARH